jgi:hypothetical protein
MIHGWAPNFAASVAESKAGGIAMPLAWNVTSLGGDFISPWNKLANIISAADPSGDVLFFSWVDLSASPFPFAGISRGSADQMGRLLAHTLNDIGINQAFVAGGGNIQLIGHSHGAEVGTIATATLQAQSAHVDLLMMLDSPENSAATALGGANRTDFPMKQINIGSGPGETLVVDYIGNESEITAYGRPSSDPRVINLTAYGSSHGSILDVYGADISAFGTASSHWLVASGRLSASQEQYQRLFQALTMQTEGSVTVDSGVTTVSEHSPSSWTTTVTTHSWDQTLTFDYQFLNAGDGDQLSVLVDGDSRFLCQGNIVGTNAFGATVDVADLAPGDHVVTFLLNSYGIPNASFILSNFALWSIPAEVRLTDVRNVAGSIVQFSFTCIPGTNFNVLSTTNLTVQLTNWVILGNATEVFPGYYQFADTKATNCSQRFYRVRLP